MTTPPLVTVAHDAQTLAAAVADRLLARLTEVQAARGSASVVLTGGRLGTALLDLAAASPARLALDWSRVDVWWGDERFVPAGSPDRNDTAAAGFLTSVDLDPGRVHAMPASAPAPPSAAGWDVPVEPDVDAAAEAYAAELAAAAVSDGQRGPARGAGGARLPRLDVVLLSIGPDGHVASLFPESPALYEQRPVVGVHASPKPPPERVTLTLPALCSADEVWLLATGEEKAGAVRIALGDAGPVQVPAAGARGRQRTLALLDRTAASQLPEGLARIASP